MVWWAMVTAPLTITDPVNRYPNRNKSDRLMHLQLTVFFSNRFIGSAPTSF